MNLSRCKVCGQENDNSNEIITAQGIFKCHNCNCLYRRDDVDYSYYSKSDYWYKGDEHLKLYQKSILAWFDNYILSGNSIEFGAADGDFISLMREKIGSEYHIDYNELVDMIRPEYRNKDIGIWVGPIEEFSTTRKYKNIFLINVIEHLNYPVICLRKIIGLLEIGGRVFMCTDDGDAFNSHDMIFYHQEHTCVLGRIGINYICDLLHLRLLRYFSSPFGAIFVIIEKLKNSED